MSLTLIGLAGNAGSGKDYIAQNIMRPLGFYQWSLSWHFKVSLVGKGIGTHDEIFIDKPPHIRRELQLEGTERGRMVYGDDIWCIVAMEWMSLFNTQWGIDKFVISDVRFPNELEFIRKMGGRIFKIHAPERVANSPLSAEARLHASETALLQYTDDDFDAILYNDPVDSFTIKQQVIDALNGYRTEGSFNKIIGGLRL